MRRLRIIGFAMLLLWLSGCGSSGISPSAVSETGRAALTIRWPERSRLIPAASESIRISVIRGGSLLAERLLTRPGAGNTTSADFDRLPVGDVTFRASALPNADGSGVAQGGAQVVVPIVAGQTAPIRLTMASTIDRIEMTPTNSAPLAAGQSVQLTATAKNGGGETVITHAATIEWTSSNSGVAAVDASGKVTAATPGSTTITAREPESGKTATVVVIVSSAPPPAAAISFAPAVSYAVPFVFDVVAGDADGDGNVDVVVAGTEHLGVLYGRGDGTLEPYREVLRRASWIGVRAIVDMDNDGRADLLCVDGQNKALVLLNQGARQFSVPIEITVGTQPAGVSVGDFNGDARPDFVVAIPGSGGSGNIVVVMNNGNGSFTVGPSYRIIGIILSVVVGDANNDGRLDFVAGATTNTINTSGARVYWGNGNGTFTGGPSPNTGTLNITGPCITDFNRDGTPDLLVGNYFDHNLAVVQGTGAGLFGSPVHYSAAPYPLVPKIADMDTDGWPDVITSNAGTSQCSVLRNRGDGTLTTPLVFPSGGNNTRACDVADLNKDGRVDIILGSENSRNVTILLNTSR
jgi:hypothetical protein